MDLLLFLIDSSRRSLTLAVTSCSIVYLIYREYSVKQVLFFYLCMLIISSGYWTTETINSSMRYFILAHFILFVLGGFLIFLKYKKEKSKVND
jgi:hypothetical protein